MHKVLITGANGMLGSSLCRLFSGTASVTALHRDDRCYQSVHADYSVDIRDRHTIAEIIGSVAPDVIIHCAGLVSIEGCENEPELAYQVNVDGTRNLADPCPDDTVFVYISTDQVYGEIEDHSERHTALEQVNQYGRTKYLGEGVVAEACPERIIVRTNTFGWNVKPGKVCSAEWIYYSLVQGREITLFDDYLFSPIYGEILGKILVDLIDRRYRGVLNIGAVTPCSKFEFGVEMAHIFGLDSSLIRRGSIENFSSTARRCSDLSLDVSRLAGLGVAVPGWRSSIEGFWRDSG